MRTRLALVALLLLIAGCTKIDYIGEEYAPTTQVDMYFSEADVTQDFHVMGHLVATAGDIVSAEKMQKKIMEKAREKGADAVIILGLERYTSGQSTNYHEKSVTKDDKDKTKTTTSGSSSTSSEEKKEIRATFIKYK
jgi:hypothetical protein